MRIATRSANFRRLAACFVGSVVFLCLGLPACHAWQAEEPTPQWIWHPRHEAGHIPQASCYFRKQVRVNNLKQASMGVAADDHFELYINGKLAGEGNAKEGIKTLDVSKLLRDGDNTIAIRVDNQNGATGGLAARFAYRDQDDKLYVAVSDATWRTSLSSSIFWTRNVFIDRRWKPAKNLGEFADFSQRQLVAVKQQQQQSGAGSNDTQASQNPPIQSGDGPGQPTPDRVAQNPATQTPNATATPNQANSNQVTSSANGNAAQSQPPTVAGQPSSGTVPSVAPNPAGRTAQSTVQVSADAIVKKLPAAGSEIEVPREFQLDQVAGHHDVGSLTAMTFDEFGQLILAREDGQLWLLLDRNEDGVLETRKDYGKLTETCQGLLALNGHVYVSGKGSHGQALYELSDSDKDGRLDRVRPVIPFLGENLEHGPHGLTLGPDGMIYLMVGNHSPLESAVAPSSPVKYAYEGDLVQPRLQDPGGHATGVTAPGGYVLRTDAEGKKIEVFSIGLRNSYDLAFNRRGALFAHDSDMESDRGSTWYRPTRLYHLVGGAEVGWRSGWAKWPSYYVDALPGIADTGRGSPTGMVFYNHRMFPSAYSDAMFTADWSNGQIWVAPCRELGSSYFADPKPFMRGRPLNVTDLDVGPDGAIYFVTGGRGTAGNVFRVSWKGASVQPQDVAESPMEAALRMPQIHSSWARQEIAGISLKMGDTWPLHLYKAAADTNRPDDERVQAMQIMQWVGPPPSLELLDRLATDDRVPVRRQACYMLGLDVNEGATEKLTQLLADPDAVVRRRACEALVRRQATVPVESLRKLAISDDRFEAWAAMQLMERLPSDELKREVSETDNQRLFIIASAALMRSSPSEANGMVVINKSLKVLEAFVNDRNFIDILRVQQLALMRGEIDPVRAANLKHQLANEYPSSSEMINRELIRLLAYLKVDSIADRYLAELERLGQSPDALHLAIHLTYVKSGWTTEQKLKIFEYLAASSEAGNSIPGYLQNVASDFGESMTDQELSLALQRGGDSPGLAMAALLRMPEKLSSQQIKTVKSLDRTLAARDDEMSKRAQIAVLAVLARDGSETSNEYLRWVFDHEPHRRIEASLGMAETMDLRNWDYLVRSLGMLEPQDAKTVIMQLKKFRRWPNTADPYAQVIVAAERLQADGAPEAIALLEYWQGFGDKEPSNDWRKSLASWKRWFAQQYPNETLPTATARTQGSEWDQKTLLQHLTRAHQSGQGSVANGRTIFTKAKCAQCHVANGMGESMGPDLTGLSKRFQVRDVVESLVEPSKIISDQYQAKHIFTTDGRTLTGIVSQAPGNELIVLETTGRKTRLPMDEVDEIEPSQVSAMPEGLLNELTLEEITDLFAFLMEDGSRVAAQPQTSTK